LRVEGVGFSIQGLGFGHSGSSFRVEGLRVSGYQGFRIQGFRFPEL
jgi:hypothetical protein